MVHPATRDVEGAFSVPRTQVLAARLTDDGLPTGNANINGNYSGTPGVFFVAVPTGQQWYVVNISVYIAGSGLVVANGYGPIPALTNGNLAQFEASDESPLIPPPPTTIKTNGDFKSIGFTLEILDTGAGVNHVTAVQSFTEAFKSPLVLTETQRAVFRPRDDLTALTQHNVVISGHWLSSP